MKMSKDDRGHRMSETKQRGKGGAGNCKEVWNSWEGVRPLLLTEKVSGEKRTKLICNQLSTFIFFFIDVIKR